MKLNKKLVVIPIFIIASSAVISTAISCVNKEETHLVTFHAGEGHTINSKKVYAYKTSNIEFEPNPDDKYGTTFLGWKKNNELKGDYYTFPLKVTTDLDFYADYNVSKDVNVVTFNTYEGTEVPKYNVNVGESIETAPLTTRNNYIFNGWKKNPNDTEVIKFPFTPTGNVTLHASWTHIDKYYLYFYTNGGTAPANSTADKEKGEYVYTYNKLVKNIENAPTSTKANYNLLGWYDDAKCEDEHRINFPLNNINANLTMYAKWEFIDKSGYTLTLLDEDKSTKLGTLTNTTSIAYEPNPGIKKENYVFDGWYDNSENKIDFSKGSIKIIEDTTWHAKWKINDQCKVILQDVNGTELSSKNYYRGSEILSPFTYTGDYSKYGNFIGWKNGENIIQYPYNIPNQDELTLKAVVHITSAIINVYDSEDEKTIIKSLGNIKSLNTTPAIYKSDRPEDYDFDHFYYYQPGTTTKVDVPTIDADHPFVIKDHTNLINDKHEIKLYAAWNSSTRRYRVTLKYGSDMSPTTTILEHQKSNVTPKDLPTIISLDGGITGWKEEGKETVYSKDSTTPLDLNKDTTFIAVWNYTHRSFKVKRIDGTIDKYTHQPIQFKLNDVPKGSKAYSDTVGYKIDDDETVHGLDETITLSTNPDSITTLTEIIEQSSCKLTIKYIYDDDPSKTVQGTRVIDNQPLKFNLATLPVDQFQDYILNKYYYNDIYYLKDADIELKKSETYEAEIFAVLTKNAFTVTFNYQDDDTSPTIHLVEHCSKLSVDNIPNPTRTGFRFDGWKDKDGKKVDLIGKVVTEPVTYYAIWVDPSVEFTVTFDLGTYQAAAEFKETTERSYEVTGTKSILADECPKPTCAGCAFLGWFINENEEIMPSYPLTTTQTLYARWAPRYGYSTICLNLTDGGIFDKTESYSTLLTVLNKTTWGSIKENVPSSSFTESFKVIGWTKTKGSTTPIGDEEEINEHTYLYSIVADDVGTPESFTGDSWATFCAFADEGYSAMTKAPTEEEEGSPYYEQWHANENFPDSFVGFERKLNYAGKEYIVRVVGDMQDFGDIEATTKLPVTFEFKKIIADSGFDSTTSLFKDSKIKTMLDEDGLVYKNMSPSLIKNKHIATTYKYVNDSSITDPLACKLFLPSSYELVGSGKDYKKKFRYTAYKNCTAGSDLFKTYDAIGSICCYWLRDYNSDGHALYVEDNGAVKDSWCYYSRGISPFFCVGKAE